MQEAGNRWPPASPPVWAAVQPHSGQCQRSCLQPTLGLGQPSCSRAQTVQACGEAVALHPAQESKERATEPAEGEAQGRLASLARSVRPWKSSLGWAPLWAAARARLTSALPPQALLCSPHHVLEEEGLPHVAVTVRAVLDGGCAASGGP